MSKNKKIVNEKLEIKTFLLAFRPTGLQSLTAICPKDTKNIKSKTFDMPAEVDDAVEWIVHHNINKQMNVYFSVNPVKEKLNKKPADKDILCVLYAHVDLDPKVTDELSYVRARKELLNSAPDGATFLIDSGNGLQGFYRHATPLTDFALATEYNKALCAKLKGDPGTHDISRIMRIPETINYASDIKLSKGYPEETTSKLLKVDEQAHFRPETVDLSTSDASSDVTDEIFNLKPTYDNQNVIDNLDDLSRKKLVEGVEKGKRSEEIFFIAKDLLRAGAAPKQAAEILCDPNNLLSQKALEKTHGDIKGALNWTKKYTIKNAYKSVMGEWEDLDEIEEVTNPKSGIDLLPPIPEALCHLPGNLGVLQDAIYSHMIYKDRASAGLTALTVIAGLAQGGSKIATPMGDVALCQWFINAAITGFGKDRMRSVIMCCMDTDNWSEPTPKPGALIPEVYKPLPGSAQGLHLSLEGYPNQIYVPDEFGDYLSSSNSSGMSYKRETLAYAMEIYTTPFGFVNLPKTKTTEYNPINNPKISFLASTTPERLAEAISVSAADSGTYNRMIILVNSNCLTKDYEPTKFKVTTELAKILCGVLEAECKIKFATGTNDYMKEYDTKVCEPLKISDPKLANRLNEQSIKIAGLICLADGRKAIEPKDLEVAYKIRMGLYRRASEYLSKESNISGQSNSSVAYDQIIAAIERVKRIGRSKMVDYSRKFRALEHYQQEAILKAIVNTGLVRTKKFPRGIAYIWIGS